MFAFWILFTSCATTTTTFRGFIFVPGHWTADSVLYGVPNCEIAVQKNEGGSPNDGVLSCLVCSEGFHLVLTGEDGYQKHICEENPPPVLLECPSPEPCICEDCPTCEQCPTCELQEVVCPTCEECPTMFELPEVVCPTCEEVVCPTCQECPTMFELQEVVCPTCQECPTCEEVVCPTCELQEVVCPTCQECPTMFELPEVVCPTCEQSPTCEEVVCPTCEEVVCPTMFELPEVVCPTCQECPTCELQEVVCPTLEYLTAPLEKETSFTTFDATFLLESISELFTMSQTNEPQQETTIEPGLIVLYCFVGLFILCMLVIILVLIIRKKKNQKVSSSGTMTEVDQTTVLPPSPSTFIPPPITLESFNPFELPEDERST